MSGPERCRLRDLGVAVGVLPTGPLNAITDVPGVRVGHCTVSWGGPELPHGSGPAPRDGAVADAHSPHVGDGVQRTGGEHADGDAEVAQSAALRPAHPATPGCPRGAP